jgi:predicted RNase H-like HicB family nuclease
MPDYPAIIDGEDGAYGVTFPDLPGIVAMGKTIEESLEHAKEALLDYAVETEADMDELIPPSRPEDIIIPAGQSLVSIPLIRDTLKV